MKKKTYNFMLYTKDDLVKIKENLSSEDICYLESQLEDILEDYTVLKKSVIYTKEGLNNVDLNDYVSIAPYWWPNPNTVDSLPYIRRDGYIFDEAYSYDKLNFVKLGYDIYHLCLLYYFTDNKKYYNCLKRNIYYYLLSSETGMNPNMNHAQMIRGINDGRCIGIIDYSNSVAPGFWMFNLLFELGYIDILFKEDLNKWVNEFLDWMVNSNYGIEESNEHNNHAIFHDLGTVILADFVGNEDIVNKLYKRVIDERIKLQIAEDGSMPHELARTRSKLYSSMALRGILNFSIVSNKYNLSIFNNILSKNKIIKAIDYIYETLIYKNKEWEYEQIDFFDEVMLIPLINEARKNISINYNQIDKILEKNIISSVSYFLGLKLLK